MHRQILWGALCAFLLLGCSSQRGLVGTSALKTVKPLKELDADVAGFPVNLVVRATNIADFSHSNKNRFELFVNDKLVRPRNNVHNGSRTYVYHLKLMPGYYKVEGVYHWHDGTRKVKTRVTTRELVPIEPRQRTVLNVAMEKDWRGILLNERPMFAVSFKPLEGSAAAVPVKNAAPEPETKNVAKLRGTKRPAAAAGGDAKTTPALPSPPADTGTVPATLSGTGTPAGTVLPRPLPPEPQSRPKVQLQINTVPDNCDIIIDDEMVGQSPLSVWVSRDRSHVVQIKHPDYQTVIRFIDQEKLRTRDQMIVIERLQEQSAEASPQ